MPKKNIAFKYRLYPNNEQEKYFTRTFGCTRKIWNLMLSDKNEHYENTKQMLYITPAKYKDEYPYLKEVDSLALANVQLQLERAFNSFLTGKTKHPKFKSKKHDKCSYTTNPQKTKCIVGDAIKLPKIGCIKAVIHRQIPDDHKIKNITVRKQCH